MNSQAVAASTVNEMLTVYTVYRTEHLNQPVDGRLRCRHRHCLPSTSVYIYPCSVGGIDASENVAPRDAGSLTFTSVRRVWPSDEKVIAGKGYGRNHPRN